MEPKTKLKDLRKEKKVSQNDLAKLLGVTGQAYSYYEREERELGYDALVKLANYFKVSIDYLLGNSAYYYPDSVQALSTDEREILELYKALTSTRKEDLKIYLRALSSNAETSTTKKKA